MNENLTKVKGLLREIAEKDTYIGKLNDQIKSKDTEIIEITRKYDLDLINVSKDVNSYINKIKEQDDYIKDTKEEHEILQTDYRKLKYEHNNFVKINESAKNNLIREKDELEIKYQQTLSKQLDIENKYNLVMVSTKDLRYNNKKLLYDKCKRNERISGMEHTRGIVQDLYERLTYINSYYKDNINDSASSARALEEMKSYLVRTEEKLVELEKFNIEMNYKVVELTSENQLLKQKLESTSDKDEKYLAADNDRKKYEEMIKDKSNKLNDLIEYSKIISKKTMLDDTKLFYLNQVDDKKMLNKMKNGYMNEINNNIKFDSGKKKRIEGNIFDDSEQNKQRALKQKELALFNNQESKNKIDYKSMKKDNTISNAEYNGVYSFDYKLKAANVKNNDKLNYKNDLDMLGSEKFNMFKN
eukprot:Mrub_04108.p1 GENE.Mrub_04108~~Mrub_04108.p1  ORF type:complete len:434 (+),score=112.87 Mrub_04108:60-1304(+)